MWETLLLTFFVLMAMAGYAWLKISVDWRWSIASAVLLLGGVAGFLVVIRTSWGLPLFGGV